MTFDREVLHLLAAGAFGFIMAWWFARLLFNHALYSLATGDEQRARELYDHAIDAANGCYLREARADLHFLRRCGLMTQSIDSLLSHLERAA